MLSKKAISEFKRIYLKEFGNKLNDNEANEKGLELLNFFKLIFKPIPKTDMKLLKKLIINKNVVEGSTVLSV